MKYDLTELLRQTDDVRFFFHLQEGERRFQEAIARKKIRLDR